MNLELTETGFDGLKLIKPEVYGDARGYFLESFNIDSFKKAGISFTPVQDNESRSVQGVIRGLHYQLKPHEQAKLIRVIEGRIYDVALDLRKSSSTFGKWFGVELDSVNKMQLFIPKGFAHGFSVLSNIAVIQYKVDNLYNGKSERGIDLNDPELDIKWGLGNLTPVISDKDRLNPVFREAEKNF